MSKSDLQSTLVGAASLFRDYDLALVAEYGIMVHMLIGAIEIDKQVSQCSDTAFRSILSIIPPIGPDKVTRPPEAWSSLMEDDDDEITDELMHQWLREDPRDHLTYYYMLFWQGEDTLYSIWMAMFARAWAYRLIYALYETPTGKFLYLVGERKIAQLMQEVSDGQGS